MALEMMYMLPSATTWFSLHKVPRNTPINEEKIINGRKDKKVKRRFHESGIPTNIPVSKQQTAIMNETGKLGKK